MKLRKVIAALLAAVMLCSVFGVAAFAETVNRNGMTVTDEWQGLIDRFEGGKGPETNGYQLDYKYYSPVAKKNDKTKYPLVIFLHGMGEGHYDGEQIFENPIAYWASDEFQSRFAGTKGAYILCPRSLEEKGLFWDYLLVEPLRATIDDFIAKNEKNVDTTRIYIGGFSMGGKMTLKMCVAYTDMFAAAFPICPAWIPFPDDAVFENVADLPIWMTSSKNDPAVNYYLVASHFWNVIKANANDKTKVRFSSLNKAVFPDGSNALNGHFAWLAVENDMFSSEKGDYPGMKTVDGNGDAVTLSYPNGMISWLSQFRSEFDGTPIQGTGNLDISGWQESPLFSLNTIIQAFKDILWFMQGLLEAIRPFTEM